MPRMDWSFAEPRRGATMQNVLGKAITSKSTGPLNVLVRPEW